MEDGRWLMADGWIGCNCVCIIACNMKLPRGKTSLLESRLKRYKLLAGSIRLYGIIL